jgi:ribosome-associated protein
MTKPYYLMPDDENYISKTEIKQEAKDLKELAEKLVKLSKSQRAKLTASDELQDAFKLADKISNKPDALRRHFQFMAKLLRDEALDTLKLEYQKILSPTQDNDAEMRLVESWRTKLLNNGDDAINKLLEDAPTLERQKLRQLVRQANKELAKEKPGKSHKELFQYVKGGLAS